jgi:hypothetical protein
MNKIDDHAINEIRFYLTNSYKEAVKQQIKYEVNFQVNRDIWFKVARTVYINNSYIVKEQLEYNNQ